MYFHFTNPNSQNWLWFLPVLFAFNMLYLILSKTKIKTPDVSLKGVVLGVVVIGFVYSCSIGGALGFRSWTLTPLIDFENERALIYFMTFLLGALCFHRKVFAGKPKGRKLYIAANVTAWIPITVHIFARIYPFIFPEGFSVTPLYRLIWWISFDLSLLCLLYLMIESFRRYANKSGRIWIELNRNSYGVYIIHVIMIGFFGTMLLNLDWPALAKYPTLIILTYLSSNVVVSGYRSLIIFLKSRAIKAREQLLILIISVLQSGDF